MISAVVDTNVICSGLITPLGVPGMILRAWEDGRFMLITTEATLYEVENAIEYPKIRRYLGWSESTKGRYLHLLRQTRIEQPRSLVVPELTDQKDLMFLEAAAAAEANYLVTGDSALLRLESYETTEIVTPRRFLTILELQT